MKKLILVLLLMGLFICPAFAESRQGSTITGYSASTLIKRGDWKVYRISYVATSNGGSFSVYDALAGTTTANSNVKAEGSEATSLNSKVLDYSNKPLEGSTGLYLVVNSANVVVEYE